MITTVGWVVAGTLVAAGIILTVTGFTPNTQPVTTSGPRAIRRWRSRPHKFGGSSAIGAAAVVGIGTWVLTGWAVAAVILPAGAAVVPALLRRDDPKKSIRRLEALEDWTRNLAGIHTVGVGLTQAIEASLRTSPEPIRGEVAAMVGRLRVTRWTTEKALRAFAEDLADPTGDRVAQSLIIGSRSNARELATVLTKLADSVGDEVKMRRKIETDRAKPRAQARYVTIIVILTTGLIALMGDYMSAYTEPVGQLMLIGWLLVYLACLWWMRQITALKQMPRVLGDVARRQQAGST